MSATDQKRGKGGVEKKRQQKIVNLRTPNGRDTVQENIDKLKWDRKKEEGITRERKTERVYRKQPRGEGVTD